MLRPALRALRQLRRLRSPFESVGECVSSTRACCDAKVRHFARSFNARARRVRRPSGASTCAPRSAIQRRHDLGVHVISAYGIALCVWWMFEARDLTSRVRAISYVRARLKVLLPKRNFRTGPFPPKVRLNGKEKNGSTHGELRKWSPLTQVAPTLLALTGSVQRHRLRSLRSPEDSCKREFADGVHGLRPTSQRLNQWCFVGTTNHDLCHPPKTKNKKIFVWGA